jgi:hypothetical protein
MRHIWKVSTIRLLKKTKIYFQIVLFLSNLPYLKLLFYTVSTIIKAFSITTHQFLYPLLVERGYLQRQLLLHCFFDVIIIENMLASMELLHEQMKVTCRQVWAVVRGDRSVPSQIT